MPVSKTTVYFAYNKNGIFSVYYFYSI